MWISVPLLCLRGKLWDRKHHCGFGRGSRLFSFLWAVTSSGTVEKSFSLDCLCSEPCLLVCGSLPLKRTLRNYGWKVSPRFHVSLCEWVFGADRCGDLQDQIICELYAVTFHFVKYLTLFYFLVQLNFRSLSQTIWLSLLSLTKLNWLKMWLLSGDIDLDLVWASDMKSRDLWADIDRGLWNSISSVTHT